MARFFPLRNDTPPELLTTKEAAAILRVSPQTVRNLAKTGAIRSFTVGKKLRIPRAELLVWIHGKSVD